MPELPEMEAWRRALDDPVSRVPDREGGPGAHRDAEDVRPAAVGARGPAAGGRASGAPSGSCFPTEDGELVLLVHLMSAGRLRYLRPGEKGPKTPAFRLRFQGGGELVLTEGGPKKRAGVWLLTPEAAEAELAHLGPEALGLGAERARRDPAGRLAAAALAAPRPAGDRRHRPRVGERDPPHCRESLAVRALPRPVVGGGRAALGVDRRGARPRPRAPRARREGRRRLPRPQPPRRAVPANAARRSRAWTSRSTRSTTARVARPAVGSSRTAACRACSSSHVAYRP